MYVQQMCIKKIKRKNVKEKTPHFDAFLSHNDFRSLQYWVELEGKDIGANHLLH